jgi:hypothetical protein
MYVVRLKVNDFTIAAHIHCNDESVRSCQAPSISAPATITTRSRETIKMVRDACQQRKRCCHAPSMRVLWGLRPPQPPYRYRGSHSVMPGQMYMMTMQMITMSM